MKIAKINFGISSYSRYSPGIPWEERIMEILETGKLPAIPDSLGRKRYLDHDENIAKLNLPNYSDVRADRHTELPAVRFGLLGEHSHDTFEMYLIWLEQRSEWVAVVHHEWSESDLNIDASESGPYALDDYCLGVLMRAYNLPSGRLLHQEVKATRPSELEKIASEVLR